MTNIDWNLVISLVSLFISISGIIYAYFNKVINIDITGVEIDDGNNPKYLWFYITNASNSAIKITDVKMSKNGRVILDNGYSPSYSNTGPVVIGSLRLSEPFKEPFYIQPNEKISFSYYVNDEDIPNTITLKSTSRITKFSKRKLFSVVFKSDQHRN